MNDCCEAPAHIRAEVRRLLDHRERELRARGLVLMDGEWCEADGRTPVPERLRVEYRTGYRRQRSAAPEHMRWVRAEGGGA